MKELCIKDICKKDSSSLKQKELKESGRYPVYGASGIAGYLDSYQRGESYIGIVKDGSGIGRVVFYPEKTSLIGTMQYILPKEGYDIRYIGYCLQSLDLSKYKQGAAIPHIYFRDYGERKVNVTDDLKEQQRIVSRLDSAFAHIDELKANAEKQLSEARALFQKALTKAMEPKEGWKEKELGDIVFYFSGYAFESKGYTNNNDDVLLICGDNIVHCDFRWETIKHWPKEEYEDLKRFSLEENDIVLAMDRPWVKSGLKIAKVSPKELPSLLIQRTACIRAPKDISSDFIFYSLQTDKYIKHLVSQQTGVGVPHISGKQILSYKISIPNFKEQQRIVSRLDSLSTHVRELEEVTQKTIAECDALKQALLRQVFE